ncbi:MAG TPA: hypothetical protein VJO99_13815, partial [Burkholderiaceae bacterium]|nr:hypothetical protein [Burkholderiaceae bacterium]
MNEGTPNDANATPLATTVEALLDRAGELFMSAPNQALACADEALALLPPVEPDTASAPHALARRARGIALHFAGRH